ncbi:MAG: hypothetical protein UT32_C0013G0018 [Parcubacteria group bacterium GW2011_GWC2_39_14]|nr:MAG: hypothetical protein UT32_C0013G0018 [Parcubacteria group bacterium GW2011_GWC2_39_14]KKR54506.1 MAG: hypothetical protein UT91_C0014G0018 [Parcubacteria group bacterium GW2011_GWA2_40_23]
MEKRPLVLYDIDKTLLDKHYKPNSDRFVDSVIELQRAGWVVGLNSDTPAVRIARLALEWNCDGPIVSEFGNAIYRNGNEVLSTSDCKPEWTLIPAGEHGMKFTTAFFLEELRRSYPEFYIMVGNPTDILQKLPQWQFDRPLIVVNPYRRFSLSFFLRLPEGLMNEATGQALLVKMANIAKECFGNVTKLSCPDPLVDINHDYGVAILHYAEARKSAAMTFLSERYAPIIMVGDSMNDYMAEPREISPAIQLAVGNATADYKDHCVFSSKLDLTLGAMDCAKWIIENTSRLRGE